MAQEHYQFLVPLIGAGVWLGGLLAMMITWAAQGKPHYISQDDSIPFISDIAADILKPLFIAVCVITASSFVLSLAIERWLRHVGRMPRDMRRRGKVFAWLAICGALLGGVGLILLSIFDTKRHYKLHRVFWYLIFVLGVALSAIFTVLEFRWLNKHYTYFPRLRRSYIAKAIIVLILIILAIAFGVTLGTKNNAAAVLEWVVAFGFTFYLLTFVYDLRLVRSWVDKDSKSGSHELVPRPEVRY
ncbi:Frag1/DRAM/Sfk1 [Gautieria morchelliformis]|nr:Frag1/DRAM/Sfk1 [Gautieria morchelliformis]